MPKIQFYILANAQQQAVLHFVCRLAEKVYSQGRRIYIHAAEHYIQPLDQALWTYRQDSFVPHETWDGQADVDNITPILISAAAPAAHWQDVLINLEGQAETFFSQFQQYLEIVPPAGRSRARQAYRYYRDHGCALEAHQINN